MNRKPSIAAGVCIAAILAAIASMPKWVGSHPDLIRSSQIVMTLTARPGRSTYPTVEAGYLWIDNDHLIYNAFHDWTSTGVFTANIRTEEISEVPVPSSVGARQLVDVSPDGKWLLWNDLNSNANHTPPIATSIDGRSTVAWKRSVVTSPMLVLPDNDHTLAIAPSWFYSTRPTYLVEYSLKTGKSEDIRITGVTPYFRPLGIERGGQLLFAQDFDGVNLPPGILNHPVMMYRVDMNGLRPLAAVQTRVIPPTTNAFEGCVELSPQGDRLLWWFNSIRKPQPWDRYLPWLHRSNPNWITVYVTDINGRHAHEIGETYEVGMDEMVCPPRWCPDGFHISFVWNKKLYMTDAR